MDCCGHWHTHAPSIWSPALTPVCAMLAGETGPHGSTAVARTAETASAALDVLRKTISVDVHTHGGKTGITSGQGDAGGIAGGGLPRRRTGQSDPCQE